MFPQKAHLGRWISGACIFTLPALFIVGAKAQTVIIKPQNNMDEIVVTGTLMQKPAFSTSVPKDSGSKPAADTGEYLRSIPGVTSGRMGGHALEPVIRGQSRSQINILTNGAFLEGAGPNRMDTSASFADIDTADLVIIHRGYQSVQHGPGGSGGTILIEHHAPTFKDGQNIKGRVDGSYESNGEVWSAAGNLSARSGNFYVRVNAHYKDAGNYEDGNNDEVRTAFRYYGGSADVGYSDASTLINLGVSHEETRDTLFPGTGMDSPAGDGSTVRAKFNHDFDGDGPLKALKMDIYRSHSYHMMDNFSLRDGTMMFRRAELEMVTLGGRLAVDLQQDDADVTLGMDIKELKHEGFRFGSNMDRADMSRIQSVLMPDATVRNIGLFAEATKPLSDNMRLKAGLRYDNNKSSADSADMKNTLVMPPMMPLSPNMLYQQYYGVTATRQVDNTLGGLLRMEYDITDAAAFYMGLSRSNRSASTVERYNASLMGDTTLPAGGTINDSWIGNPNLAPEKHTQFDMGLGIRKSGWNILASAYYDDVKNYIFRDRARGQHDDQTVIMLSNNALIYRNIKARIWGVELEGSARISDMLTVTGNMAYTNGQNRDLDIPLYQIPPLSYEIAASYEEANWSVGGRLHGALKQDRVDDNPLAGSGRDFGETDGYLVVDLFASINIMADVTLKVGVSNLLDKLYANHLNRESLDDATVARVNEPGRSVYFRIQSEF